MRLRARLRMLLGATVATVLTVGLPAAPGHGAPGGSGGPEAARAAAGPGRVVSVTLITGDRVTVRDGAAASVEPGPGRAGTRFVVQRVAGHLFVIPSDALGLVRAGTVDRRLFDVTALVGFGYDDRRADLPLIVTSPVGERSAAGVRTAVAAGGARVVREVPALGALAVRADKKAATRVWAGLTTGGPSARSLRGGVQRVWLDGKYRPTLDTSVAQVGAPAAWRAGLDGKGVTVAVLDTGIDATHPDLAGQVTAQRTFTEGAEDDRDRVGHGTHVASTIAGTGKASGGRYRGVAPGAKLLDGKVCVDRGCEESWILAGMAWAAAEKRADVVNMSLGGPDTPEVDPIEQAVNDLSARHGTLFVISAGNSGADASVGSPGSADAALTVGAVSKKDQLAGFSSRGPRVGDDAVKPDITAPGVEIMAARSTHSDLPTAPVEGYTSMSGTSMAAPHVAGAAAILAQQHPTWTPQQLKTTLMGSAKPAAKTGVFAQGAGRVDVARAVTQTVSSEPGSVSFGRQLWPHSDDTPVTRTLTYRNSSSRAVSLKLVVRATGPDGRPAPAGVFTLGATSVTVPAGGQAQVSLTADTRVKGPDGFYTGHVEAVAGSLRVVTPFAVHREVESYDVTFEHIERDGSPADVYDTTLIDLLRAAFYNVSRPDGTVKMRLPKGRYGLVSTIVSGDEEAGDITMLVRTRLDVDRTQRVVLDARTGRPVSVTVPDKDAVPALVASSAIFSTGDSDFTSSALVDRFDRLYAAQVGPTDPVKGFYSQVDTTLVKRDAQGTFANSPYSYHLTWFRQGTMLAGLQRTLAARDLATIRATYARQAEGVKGARSTFPVPPFDGLSWAAVVPFDLPFRQTVYVNSDGGLRWDSMFEEQAPRPGDHPDTVGMTYQPPKVYQAGRTYQETWNRAVFAPTVANAKDPDEWASRTENLIAVGVPLFADGSGRAGTSTTTSTRTALYRNGTKVGEAAESYAEFTVPRAAADYRLEMSARRGAPHVLSTQEQATWTFRSGHVGGGKPSRLPLSTVRFTPPLDLHNSAPAGRLFSVPVTVDRHPGSGAQAMKSLTVEVSYDDGRTWKTVPVLKQPGSNQLAAVLEHPERAGFVSLRAKATDKAGNTVTQTVVRAYRIA